jgi:inhibitor of cysteine peptidase
MMKRICSISVLLVTFALLAGCISNEVKLGVSDNGSQIKLNKGQMLVITLEANPTTGYTWEVAESNTSIMRQVGAIEFQSESSAPGAGGVQTLHFEAVNAGQTPLKLVYHRPWEKDVEPLKTFSLQVVVQ